MARGHRTNVITFAQAEPYKIEILNYDGTYSRCVNPTVTDGVLTASIGGTMWGASDHLIIQFSVSDESVLSIASALTLNARYHIVNSNNVSVYNSASAGTITLSADVYTFYIYYPLSNVNDLDQHGITVRKK